METFDNSDSWAAMRRHPLAPPVHTLDAETMASFNLNHDDIYQVTVDSKVRNCVFEAWHGQHCLFISPKDDWRLIIFVNDLRKMVKRVKA